MSQSANRQLEEILQRLYRRNLHTIQLGLDAVEALLRELRNPERAYAAIHVAGTNGKGSVCAILDAISRAAGLRVGLYTSPHLVAFNERIRVNGAPIDDGALVAEMEQVEEAALRAQKSGSRDVTFFEFTTALAFHYFRNMGVQLAVVETGMGGRLDATNVITPLVSVITSISFDHMAWLGDTLEKIAREKAGIIKAGRPVVIGALPPEAEAVMIETSREKGAPLVRAADVCAVSRITQTIEGQKLRIETPDGVIGTVACPLLGRHQLANISIAITALKLAERRLGVSIIASAIRAGLASVSWPARAQLIEREPPTLLDGAHNPEAMNALLRTVDEISAGRPIALVAGFLADKDAASCLAPWRGRAARVFLALVDSHRAMSSDDMRAAALRAGIVDAAPPLPLRDAWQNAREWCRRNGALLIIAGSLYLAGEVLRLVEEGFLARE